MKRIIVIVEDNFEVSEIVSIFLQNEGFETVVFETAEDAFDYFSKKKADLIVLDINLPGMDGYEFLNRIRKTMTIPVLILTARRSDKDVITGLGYGADDYVTKPFSADILVARIRALLRRADGTEAQTEKVFKFDEYAFNHQTLELFKDDKQISLSTREARLLDYLIANHGKYENLETIYSNVWKNKYGDFSIIPVYIQRLRRKIEANPAEPVYIKTLFGSGYGFFCLSQNQVE